MAQPPPTTVINESCRISCGTHLRHGAGSVYRWHIDVVVERHDSRELTATSGTAATYQECHTSRCVRPQPAQQNRPRTLRHGPDVCAGHARRLDSVLGELGNDLCLVLESDEVPTMGPTSDSLLVVARVRERRSAHTERQCRRGSVASVPSTLGSQAGGSIG